MTKWVSINSPVNFSADEVGTLTDETGLPVLADRQPTAWVKFSTPLNFTTDLIKDPVTGIVLTDENGLPVYADRAS